MVVELSGEELAEFFETVLPHLTSGSGVSWLGDGRGDGPVVVASGPW